MQVAGANHGATWWQAVEIAQEQVLCIPRASIHFVDDPNGIDSEQRTGAEAGHPLFHGFNGDELAVEFLNGETGAGQGLGHHVGDAGFADTGWAVEQDFYRDGGITVELACLGDESAGDNGGGAAEVIGSGRSPRQRRACGARCRVRQNLEEL